MITQELLGYIRTELSKGKTREEIRGVLLSDGEWNEDDLSEAFRTVIPMQSVILPKEKPIEPVLPPSSLLLKSTPLSQPPSSSRSLFSLLKFLVILIIVGGLGFGSWYYRSQINSQMMNLSSQTTNLINSSFQQAGNLWTSLVGGLKKFHFPSLGINQTSNKATPAVTNAIPQKTINEIKNCGISVTPKLDTPSTYKNDPVLSCLGASAINCENAKGILKDDFFPTVFEITKLQNSCNFKLSYPANSALADITGKQLAGQYISCPIDIVKTIDNTKPASPKFLVPSKTDLSKYASDVYFYGTLGLFIENNLDPNKIQALGCSGEYIQSVIASYRLVHAK